MIAIKPAGPIPYTGNHSGQKGKGCSGCSWCRQEKLRSARKKILDGLKKEQED